jgi:hypothetical protein
VRVVQRTGLARFTLVVVRLDIRGAAHKQQPVERFEQIIELKLTTQGWNDHRYAASRVENRRQILFTHQMVRLRSESPPIRGYPDQWAL